MTSTTNIDSVDERRRAFLAVTATTSAVLAGATIAGPAIAQSVDAAPNPLGVSSDEVDIATLPRIQQKLVDPPFAPVHDQVASLYPAKFSIADISDSDS